MPTTLKISHTSNEKNIGSAIRALTGICTKGMTSHRLQNRMNVNNDVRNGVNLRPSGPMVSNTRLLSTKSMIDSATFCTPLGTNARLRLPATNNAIARIAEIHINKMTLLTAKGVPLIKSSRHSMRWLIGGNWRPKVTLRQPPRQWLMGTVADGALHAFSRGA